MMERLSCFIDELHTIVGAGKTDGAMDAGNYVKADAGTWRAALYRCNDTG